MEAGSPPTPPGTPGDAHLALNVAAGTIRVWEWHAQSSVRPVDWRLVNEIEFDDRTEIDVDGRVVVQDGQYWVFVDDLEGVRTW